MKQAAILSAIGFIVGAIASPVSAQQAAGLTDANIVAIFDAANTADIETGQLAAKKGTSQAVKDLGSHFASDHQAVRQQGRDLAKKLGVTPQLPAGDQGAAAHAKVMEELKAKSGAEFDRAFAAHEVAFHQAVIDAVTKTLLPATKNPELKAFVEKVGPAFQGHLEAAKSVQQKLSN